MSTFGLYKHTYVRNTHTWQKGRQEGREEEKEEGRETRKEKERKRLMTDFLALLLQEAPREFFYPYSTIQVSEATAVTSPNPLTAS